MSNNMEATPVSTYIPEWASEFLKTGGKKKVRYTPAVTVQLKEVMNRKKQA